MLNYVRILPGVYGISIWGIRFEKEVALMANFTEKAIKASFIKLLNQKPISKISVKDIVEDCGINRNSFYYHFSDIPALLEDIITEVTSAIIAKYPAVNSLDQCFSAAFDFALENKKAAFHIYNSVSRDIFERELMKLCDYAVRTYVDSAFEGIDSGQRDREVVLRFIKCSCFGLVIDWLNNGMEDSSIDDLLRINKLCRGFSEEIIRRIRED